MAQASRFPGSTLWPRSPSTNTALLGLVASQPDAWGHLSAYVADHQTAGRGRAGRSWATPDRAALTGSYVLRPSVARADYGWAPLVVGLATVRALRRQGVGAFLKWPNDVVVEHGVRDIAEWGRWRKCVGILCEVVPGQDAIVAGIGINVSQAAGELPVPHAASLATLGASSLDRVALLRALAAELRDAVAAWERGDDIPALVDRRLRDDRLGRDRRRAGWHPGDGYRGGPVGVGRAVGKNRQRRPRGARGGCEGAEIVTITEERTAMQRPGSAGRAAIGMAGTSAILVLVSGLALGPVARLLFVRDTTAYYPFFDFWAVGWMTLVLVALVGVPVISFTVGRRIDRRLAGAGAGTSVARFAVAGALSGLLVAMVLTINEAQSTAQSDVRFAVTAALFYIVLFAVAGAGGRLLGVLAFRDVRWRVTVYAVYAVLMVPVVYLFVWAVQHSRWFN